MSDPRYRLGFHLTKGIGLARLERLLAHFGDLGAAPDKRVVLVLDRTGWHMVGSPAVSDCLPLVFLPA